MNRLVMLTLTVAFRGSVLSQDSASLAAAACTADGVGWRYSMELARMRFRSCSVPTSAQFEATLLSRSYTYCIGTLEDANKHSGVSGVHAQLFAK